MRLRLCAAIAAFAALAAAGSPAGVRAPAIPPAPVGVTFSKVGFRAQWHESTLRGALVLTGQSDSDARLELTLTSSAGVSRTLSTAVAPGTFTRSLALSRRGVWPGRYSLHVGAGDVPVTPADFKLTLRAPREGVVSRAYVSRLGSSRPVTRVPAGTRGLAAHFVFIAVPAPGLKVTAGWYLDGKLVGASSLPRVPTLTHTLRGSPLLTGAYRCVLKAGGTVVKVVTVRVG